MKNDRYLKYQSMFITIQSILEKDAEIKKGHLDRSIDDGKVGTAEFESYKKARLLKSNWDAYVSELEDEDNG